MRSSCRLQQQQDLQRLPAEHAGQHTFRCVSSSSTYTRTPSPRHRLRHRLCGGCGEGHARELRARPAVQLPDPDTFPGKTLDDGVALVDGRHRPVPAGHLKINKALTLNLGVRLDKLSAREAHLQRRGRRPDGGRQCLHQHPSERRLRPRQPITVGRPGSGAAALGFTLNLDSADKRRQQLRGGIGLFQGAAYQRVVVESVLQHRRRDPHRRVRRQNFSACSSAAASSPPARTSSPELHRLHAGANVDFIRPGLTSLRSGRPTWRSRPSRSGCGLTASASGCTPTRSASTTHLNLGAVTRTGTDGRELYYNANGYNTNCWTASGSTNAGGTGCAAR